MYVRKENAWSWGEPVGAYEYRWIVLGLNDCKICLGAYKNKECLAHRELIEGL